MENNVYVLGKLPARFTKELQPFHPDEVSGIQTFRKMDLGEKTFLLILGKDKSLNRISVSIEMSSLYSCYVLLLVESDELDQAIYQCSQYPVFVCSLNCSQTVFYQSVRFLKDLILEKEKFEGAVRKERERFNNEKMIAQAKFLMIEKLHYTEEQAHQYIQKKAMDHSMTRVAVARLILNRLKGK